MIDLLSQSYIDDEKTDLLSKSDKDEDEEYDFLIEEPLRLRNS
jgi:hypothetical protein